MARVEIKGPGARPVPPPYKPATRPAPVPGRQPIVTGKVQSTRRLETAPPSAPLVPSTPMVPMVPAEPIAHFPAKDHHDPILVNPQARHEFTQDVNTPVTASGSDDLAIVAQFIRDMTVNKHSLTQVSTREYIGLATQTVSLESLRRITKVPLALTLQDGKFYAYPVLRKREWKVPSPVLPAPVLPAPVLENPTAQPESPVASLARRVKKKV